MMFVIWLLLFETMMAELTDAYIRHWVSMS